MKKDALVEALSIVKPGLANKEILEQTTCVAFVDETVITFNDRIAISHPLPGCKVNGAVSADTLFQFLSKIKSDEISFESKGNELRIRAGKGKAGINLDPEIKLPVDHFSDIDNWKKLPSDFSNCLAFTSFSCGQDYNRPELTCVHVTRSGIVEACDGVRLTRVRGEKMPFEFLLPETAAKQLAKYKIKNMSADKKNAGWVHFLTDKETIFSSRILQANYPDISHLVKVKGKRVVVPKGLSDVLARASIFCKQDFESDDFVTVSIAEDEMVVSAKNSAGWFEEPLTLRYKGESFSFLISPSFFAEAIAKGTIMVLSDEVVRLKGENWDHVVAMVVKVKK